MLLLFLTTLVLGGAHAKMLPAPTTPIYSREGTLACYWETYLYPEFSSTNIESNLCNHIIYGDVKLDKTTWKLTHKNRTIDVDLGGFRNVSEMKIQSPGLKVEIAAGMWQTPKEYVDMATDPARRETFVQSVIDLVGENNFDGFHLHWGSPGSAEIDQNEARTHLTILLKELKTALTVDSSWRHMKKRGALPERF